MIVFRFSTCRSIGFRTPGAHPARQPLARRFNIVPEDVPAEDEVN